MAKRKKKNSVVLQVVYGCDQCGRKFNVSHVRNEQSAICASGDGILVVWSAQSSDRLPHFYCSEECLKAAAEKK